MSTKVATISMVKDECDIIELFVKINSRMVDHMFVVDHNSRDGTSEILKQLKELHYPLTIYRSDDPDFPQAKVLSTVARRVAATNEYAFLVPLDADEFIYCEHGKFADLLAQEIPPGGCGQLPWVTYVPSEGHYYASSAPLYNIFRKRCYEPTQLYKVVIPNEMAKTCIISAGSHVVAFNSRVIPATTLSATLQHCPIRSIDQITAKGIIGSHRLSIKVGRLETEGYHWDLMAEQIRRANFGLSHADMLSMALNYLAEGVSDLSVDATAPRIGGPNDSIEMVDLSKIRLFKKLDQFMADLCAELGPKRGLTN